MSNIFGNVLTYPAPSSNYRGENEETLQPLQKVTYGRLQFPVTSSPAICNGIRETLDAYGLPCNRTRVTDNGQPSVRFRDYGNPDAYIDDWLRGYVLAANNTNRETILAVIQEERGAESARGFQFTREAIFRVNLAKALEPFRQDRIFSQSPFTTPDSRWQNATTSALLHQEVVDSAFQYPFAINMDDCSSKPEWARALFKAIGELNGVAGNHSRSYYEFAPASILIRVTTQRVRGYNQYGFDASGNFPEVIDGIVMGDYPGEEFYLGGMIVKQMEADKAKQLRSFGVTLNRNPQRLLNDLGEKLFPVAKKTAEPAEAVTRDLA